MTELLQTSLPAGITLGTLVITVALLGLLLWQTVRRRRAIGEARALRGELDAVTAHMREGVIAYDLDRQLIYINRAFEELVGYPIEDIRDQEFLQYIHPDDRTAILAEWDHLSNGGVLRDQEYRVVTRGGQVRWTSAAWQPIRDRGGRQIGYLGTEFDITERKLAEAERLQDTELFQAVLDVQQAVAAAGLDSRMVMHTIAERSQLLTGASGIVIETVAADTGTLTPSFHFGATAAAASTLAVDLKDGQRPLGVLRAIAATPDAFSARDAKALRLLSGLVGAALGHASAYEARQDRLEARTQSLHESEQRFKHLVDGAQAGICVADTAGTITYANQRLADLLGYQTGALLGRPIGDIVDPSSRPAALRLFADGLKGPTERRDLRFCRQDGSALWVLASAGPIADRDGQVDGAVAMLTDITERKGVEERLRRSAERLTLLHDMDQAILAARSPADVGRAALARLRRIVPCDHCAIILFDDAHDGARLIAGSAGTTPLSAETLPLDSLRAAPGSRRDAVQHVGDLRTVDHPAPFAQHLRDEGLRSFLAVPLLVDAEPIGLMTFAATAVNTFDDEHRDIALEAAAPIGAAMQYTQLSASLTEQTADLERRLADRGTSLRAAGAELETVLHAIAHDLRPPLRHIGGFAQLLLDETGPSGDPALRHYAGRIHTSVSRMATLVGDILRLSRVNRQDLIRRPIDLGALVEEIAGQLQNHCDDAGHGRLVQWQVESLPTVDADPVLARLAVTEVLGNAVKFSGPREHAIIGVRAIHREGQPGIAVQDNGVGFNMSHASKLFSVFQRLHRAEEFDGNGTGLALVQRIVQRHGGQVWAEGQEGAGATVYLTFGPRTPPA